MNIAQIEENSFIYGPGCRFVIWVQGCSIHCKGCWNKEMWSFDNKNIIPVDKLIEEIEQQSHLIEGITLLGGEPLDQYNEVHQLLLYCKKNNLSTMLFTGYDIEEMHGKGMSLVLESLDIIISGRFEQAKRTLHHQWIGSTNQKIHFLTKRYIDFDIENCNYVEISIDNFGKVEAFGFPDTDFLSEINA